MKHWQRDLDYIREVGPDEPRFDQTVKRINDYIERLEESVHLLALEGLVDPHRVTTPVDVPEHESGRRALICADRGRTEVSRLNVWMDEQVALMREHDPYLNEEEYREALGKTFWAAQLRVADSAEDLIDAAFGDRVFASLKAHSDRLRYQGLREWFRRHW